MKVSVSASDLLKMSTSALPQLDYAKMYEVAKAVADNPSLIAEFDADPEAAAKKINGFQVPPGFHMHIADGENSYHPPEDDALSQISGQVDESVWSRIEIRAGVGAMACIVCLWCKSNAV